MLFERGSLAGSAAGRDETTSVVIRSTRLASGEACAVAAFSAPVALGSAIFAAEVATSGRVVTRGCRLATGDGAAAVTGCGSAGLSRRWALAAGSAARSGIGSAVARVICGLMVDCRVACVLAGAIAVGEVSRACDGASATATSARGVVAGWATARRSVGWAVVSGTAALASVRRAT